MIKNPRFCGFFIAPAGLAHGTLCLALGLPVKLLSLIKASRSLFVKQFTPALLNFNALHPVHAMAAAFNLLTAQQPWAAERLARHAGKTLRITLGGFAVTMTIESDGRLVRADSAVVPDVVLEIIAERLSFDRLFSTQSSRDVAELINISGQAALAQLVSDLARDLRPEPEDALANVIGDLPANKLMQSGQKLLQAFQAFSRGIAHNTAEYLAEETHALAGQPVLAMHAQRIVSLDVRTDALSDRHARLCARLERLSSKRQHA